MSKNDRALLIFIAVMLLISGLIISGWLLSQLESSSQWIGFWGNLIGGTLAALATGGAVLGAYKVAKYQGDRASAELKAAEKMEAEAIAAAILPALWELREYHGRIRNVHSVLRDPTRNFSESRQWEIFTTVGKVSMPTVLNQCLPRIYLLGDFGRKVLTLCSIVEQYNRTVDLCWETYNSNPSDGICRDLLTILAPYVDALGRIANIVTAEADAHMWRS